MMGMWFVSSFFGNYLSGYLGTYWEKMSKTSFFVMLAGISFATGVAMIALMGPLKKAIGDENAPSDDGHAPPMGPGESAAADEDEHRPHDD